MKRWPLLFVMLAVGSSAHAAQPLVDGAWLEERLGADALVVLDIRNEIDGGSKAVFEQGHIPGAVYSDYLKAGWRGTVDGVVGMLPPVDRLEKLVGSLGIDNQTQVVVVPAGVSAADYGSATRVYWTFKVLGHDRVSILDGGYFLWVKEGRPVQRGAAQVSPALFKARLRPALLATRADVMAAVESGASRLIDNRPTSQFVGKDKHPKAVRAGAIPKATNIPQERFFDHRSGRFAGTDVLEALWKEAGATDSTQITYCNTGHWASLGWFAAHELLGFDGARLYDGSMVDWSARPELPMIYTGR